MSEREARQTLLELLQESLEEWRSSSHVPQENVLELRQDDFDRFAKALRWSTPDTWALYKRLVREGFVHQVRGEMQFAELGGRPQYAWVGDLTDKGMRAIGVLHDPTEALVQALRAAMQDVVVSEDIPEEKKPDVVGALDRVLTVARLVDGAAQLITRHLPPSG